MTFEAILLIIAAVILMASLAAPRESLLLVGIAVYTGMLLWLIHTDLAMLLPGLAIALMFGALAAWRFLKRQLRDLDVADGPNVTIRQSP